MTAVAISSPPAPAAQPAGSTRSRASARPAATKPATPPGAKPSSKLTPKAALQAPPKTPVAVVNGEAITVAQWEERMSLMAGSRALDSLVLETIVRQEARRRGVRVTPAEVDAKVTEEIASLRQRVGSEERFQEMMKSQKLSMASLRNVIGVQTEFRLLQERLRDKVTASIKVTDQELNEAYAAQKPLFQIPEEVQLSHILLLVSGTDPQADAAAKAKAEQALTRAKPMSAAQFSDLARELSEDMDTKTKGGELPALRKPSFFGPAFDDVVFAASPGVISQTIRSFRGYHVVYLRQKTEARVRPLEEVRGQLQEQLLARRRNEQFASFMDTLQKSAKQDLRLRY
jgi:parvulin-like peptidyl-prolyl isomerase